MDKVSAKELGFLGHQLLKKPRMTPLRERMEQFVDEHGQAGDVKQLRSEVAGGKPLSDIVREEREERL